MATPWRPIGPPDPTGPYHDDAWGDPFAWAGLAAMFGAVYLAARLLTGFGLWVASSGWGRRDGETWTERSRRCWPGRRLAPLGAPVVPIPLVFRFIIPRLFSNPLGGGEPFNDLLPPPVIAVLFLAISYLSVIRACSAWEVRVKFTPRRRLATWILILITLAFWVWLPFALFSPILIRRGDLELAIVG